MTIPLQTTEGVWMIFAVLLAVFVLGVFWALISGDDQPEEAK